MPNFMRNRLSIAPRNPKHIYTSGQQQKTVMFKQRFKHDGFKWTALFLQRILVQVYTLFRKPNISWVTPSYSFEIEIFDYIYVSTSCGFCFCVTIAPLSTVWLFQQLKSSVCRDFDFEIMTHKVVVENSEHHWTACSWNVIPRNTASTLYSNLQGFSTSATQPLHNKLLYIDSTQLIQQDSVKHSTTVR